MAYESGGLISAADYNRLTAGSSTGAGYDTAANWIKQPSITITAATGTTTITGNGTGSNVYFYLPIPVVANTNYIVTIDLGTNNLATNFVINATGYSMASPLATLAIGDTPLTYFATFNSGANTTVFLQSYQVSASATTITRFTISLTNITSTMGTGYGAIGYGQNLSAISTVAAAGTVTATQWSGLLTLLNGALGHQTGAGTVLSGNYTAGQTITYFANVKTAVTTINTNAALYAAQGATTTGTNYDYTITSTTGLTNYTTNLTVTFASGDAARYFFNAGGQLNVRLSTVNSADSGAESSFARLVTGLGGVAFRNTANGGRTGSGITLNTNNTALGYRTNVLNTPQTIVQVTDTTSSYTASTGYLQVYTNTDHSENGSVGATVVFRTVYSIADKTWDDSMSLTYRMAIDIVYPESTYLTTNSWGTPTIGG